MVVEHFNRFETKAKIAFVKMSLCCCSLANKIVLEIYVTFRYAIYCFGPNGLHILCNFVHFFLVIFCTEQLFFFFFWWECITGHGSCIFPGR